MRVELARPRFVRNHPGQQHLPWNHVDSRALTDNGVEK